MDDKPIYHSLRQVSKDLNIPASTLRYWDKMFTQIKPFRNKRGDRYFTNQDIEIIKTIDFLTKEKGYSLQGVKRYFTDKRINSADDTLLKTLLEIKEFLLKIKSGIN